MSAFRDAAHRAARAGPLPLPPAERLLAIEKVAARHALDRGVPDARAVEAWRDALGRIGALSREGGYWTRLTE